MRKCGNWKNYPTNYITDRIRKSCSLVEKLLRDNFIIHLIMEELKYRYRMFLCETKFHPCSYHHTRRMENYIVSHYSVRLLHGRWNNSNYTDLNYYGSLSQN